MNLRGEGVDRGMYLIIMMMDKALTSNVDRCSWKIVSPRTFDMTCMTNRRQDYGFGNVGRGENCILSDAWTRKWLPLQLLTRDRIDNEAQSCLAVGPYLACFDFLSSQKC
jgi:hypothetical protein